jgi:hypothetical protein
MYKILGAGVQVVIKILLVMLGLIFRTIHAFRIPEVRTFVAAERIATAWKSLKKIMTLCIMPITAATPNQPTNTNPIAMYCSGDNLSGLLSLLFNV